MQIKVDRDDLEVLLDAYLDFTEDAECLAALDGLGDCLRCGSMARHCMSCGEKLAMPALLTKPDDPALKIVFKRLESLLRQT